MEDSSLIKRRIAIRLLVYIGLSNAFDHKPMRCLPMMFIRDEYRLCRAQGRWLVEIKVGCVMLKHAILISEISSVDV